MARSRIRRRGRVRSSPHEARNPAYAKRQTFEHRNSGSITQEIKLTMTAQEAMDAYLRMIHAKPV